MLAENWKDFLQPSKIEYNVEEGGKIARITVDPLERGFGNTIGNSLRRTLLSSIYGTAITGVKINDVIHEQESISGISEDIVDIILNIKKIVLSSEVSVDKRISIDQTGPKIVTAGMIDLPEDIKVINPDQVICNLDKGAKFKADFIVQSGKGYRDSSKISNDNKEVGVINIDAVFSPIKRVTFQVLSSRVGEVIDYDKLIIEIETNGAIEPDLALGIAAKIMKEQLNLFINFDDSIVAVDSSDDEDEELSFDPVLLKKVEELELSVRSQNCLKNENINYIGDLVKRTENDMLKTPNFGRKSLNEIKAILSNLNLNFGEQVDEWPPENIEDLLKKQEEK